VLPDSLSPAAPGPPTRTKIAGQASFADIFHRRQRLSRAVSGRLTAVDLHRRKAVEARHELGIGRLLRRDQRGQRHLAPVFERTYTCSKSGWSHPIARVGLQDRPTRRRVELRELPAICEPKNACIVWNASATVTPSTSALLRSRSTKKLLRRWRGRSSTRRQLGPLLRSVDERRHRCTSRSVSPAPRFCM
jgi:hypothetical protein